MILSPKQMDKFLRNIEFIVYPNGVVGCWKWRGKPTTKGYGQWRLNGKNVRAHSIGREVRPGMVRDHLCRNRICVNPAHIEEVTPQINVLRGFGPSGINARKRSCIVGHPFDAENTFWLRLKDGTKKRRCMACQRARNVKHDKKRRPGAPMKIRVIKHWKDDNSYTVELAQDHQSFRLDYIGSRDECRWYARMFRIALNRAIEIAIAKEKLGKY